MLVELVLECLLAAAIARGLDPDQSADVSGAACEGRRRPLSLDDSAA